MRSKRKGILLILCLMWSPRWAFSKVQIMVSGVSTNEVWFAPALATAGSKQLDTGPHVQLLFSTGGTSSIWWEFTIKDPYQREVRAIRDSYESPHAARPSFPPATFTWDGTDFNGQPVPDGKYVAVLTIMDKSQQKIQSGPLYLHVDREAPKANVEVSSTMLRPGTKGEQGILVVEQELEEGVYWEASFVDVLGTQVKAWNWGHDAPDKVYWTGEGVGASQAADGRYDYVLVGTDRANNRAVFTVPNIQLSRAEMALFLSATEEGFSPNRDGRQDIMILQTEVGQTNKVTSFELSIFNASDEVVRDFAGKGPVLPEQWFWDGVGTDGRLQNEGKYYASLQVSYASGAVVQSPSVEMMLMNTPLDLQIQLNDAHYYPMEGTNTRESIRYFIQSTHPERVKTWNLSIQDLAQTNEVQLLRGEGLPGVLAWDGVRKDGADLYPGQRYQAILTVEDKYGNLTRVEADPVRIGLAVKRTSLGDKLVLPSILFKPGTAEIEVESVPLLDFVAQHLLKEELNVELVGILGDKEGLGDASRLTLAKERTETIKAELIARGVPIQRLRTLSLGNTDPEALDLGRVDFYRAAPPMRGVPHL